MTILKDTNQIFSMFDEIISQIRKLHNIAEESVPLHAPVFSGNEKRYVNHAIDTTYVSSVGEYVLRFERMMQELSGAKHAIAVVNGTCALHLALMIAGVKPGDEVITQPLTFVATANAIAHGGALPHFVDVDRDSLGMSPEKLESHLKKIIEIRNGYSYSKISGRRISACVPMHTFGLPLRIDEVVEVCNQFNIPVVEDSTESIGSMYKDKHTGTFGLLGTFSFNGNKTLTCGAGGAIITDDDSLAMKAKHLSTTAKIPHPWIFDHDEIGYNYRMPNLNAAMACAQLEQLDLFIKDKRSLANSYNTVFSKLSVKMVMELPKARSNYWLCCMLMASLEERDEFLKYSNENNVMTRPAWKIMTKLKMFENCYHGDLSNALWLEDRIVNIPSSVRIK
jgi:aminotransferase in exopolysaccharide biosynthesis